MTSPIILNDLSVRVNSIKSDVKLRLEKEVHEGHEIKTSTSKLGDDGCIFINLCLISLVSRPTTTTVHPFLIFVTKTINNSLTNSV
jgi:hypothetical protein